MDRSVMRRETCPVVSASALTSAGKKPRDLLAEWGENYGIAKFTAGQVRQLVRADPGSTPCPQGVMASPTDAEPWHGVVFDLSGAERRSPVCKRIAVCAEWEIPLTHS